MSTPTPTSTSCWKRLLKTARVFPDSISLTLPSIVFSIFEQFAPTESLIPLTASYVSLVLAAYYSHAFLDVYMSVASFLHTVQVTVLAVWTLQSYIRPLPVYMLLLVPCLTYCITHVAYYFLMYVGLRIQPDESGLFGECITRIWDFIGGVKMNFIQLLAPRITTPPPNSKRASPNPPNVTVSPPAYCNLDFDADSVDSSMLKLTSLV